MHKAQAQIQGWGLAFSGSGRCLYVVQVGEGQEGESSGWLESDGNLMEGSGAGTV